MLARAVVLIAVIVVLAVLGATTSEGARAGGGHLSDMVIGGAEFGNNYSRFNLQEVFTYDSKGIVSLGDFRALDQVYELVNGRQRQVDYMPPAESDYQVRNAEGAILFGFEEGSSRLTVEGIEDAYFAIDPTLQRLLDDLIASRKHPARSDGNGVWEIIGAGVGIAVVAASAMLVANGRLSPRIEPARRTMPQNLARPSVVRAGRS